MKDNIDTYLIYIGGVFEIFIRFLLMYSQNKNFLTPFVRTTFDLINNKEASVYFDIARILMVVFYVIEFSYFFVMIKKMFSNVNINIKKNTIILFTFLLLDYLLYFFNIKAFITESNAFRFVIICLLTNLVVYIKYKKNNIKIE